MKTITLNNGVKMPILGYGVFQVATDVCQKCVSDAIDVGYRLIDTAQAYQNEEGVGAAVKASGINRDEFFLVSKVWISNAGYEKAKASIDMSLTKLKTDYLDLMLIHQPFGDYYGTYRALEDAYKAGKLRAIGVSNFLPDRFLDISEYNEVQPMVNQVETHVFNQQKMPNEIMKEKNTQIMSWGPFAEGKNDFFNNEVLKAIGQTHNKSVAQVALRFLVQENVVVIPKSVNKDRMKQNFEIFDFELSDVEMNAIRQLDQGKSLFFNHWDPDFFKYIATYKLD